MASELDPIVEHLRKFGLSDREAEVYAVLLKTGVSTAREINSHAQLSRLQLYRVLQKLTSRGLVAVSMEGPRRYVSTSLDKAIAVLIQEAKDRLSVLEKSGSELIEEFHRITIEHPEVSLTKFAVINEKAGVSRARSKLIEAAEEEIRMMTTWHGLLHAINSNLDDICEKCYGKGVKVKVITEVNEQNMKAAKRFQEFGEVRHKTAPSIPQLIIADEKEVAIVPVEDNSRESQQASLMWTNSPVFASIMRQFFDYEWSTALDFRSRAREAEMATPALVKGHRMVR
jgi:sugar-specific transcriptional regulator TrmB